MPKPKKDDGDGDPVVSRQRRESSGEVVLSPSVVAITAWTVDEDSKRLPALVVPGATHYDRQTLLKQYAHGEWRRFHSGICIDTEPSASTAWLEQGIPANFMARIRSLRMPVVNKNLMAKWYPYNTGTWELLWNLIAVDEFLVDEPLRGLVDKPFYLVHDVHMALWEARFLAREDPSLRSVEDFMVHFTRWIMGEPLGYEGQVALGSLGIKRPVASITEKLDVLCFLLCLACQNGLLERVVLLFDDLEHALRPDGRAMLRQLWDLLECSRRWTRIGNGSCPLGILFGFTGSKTDFSLLLKLHPKLSVDVNAGLNWTRRTLSS